jgi:hypothetical protein
MRDRVPEGERKFHGSPIKIGQRGTWQEIIREAANRYRKSVLAAGAGNVYNWRRSE